MQARVAQLKSILFREGVRAALIYLNGQTSHRFTAMFRFDDPKVRNLHFYDRENPLIEFGDDYPVEASYCVYIRDTDRPFVVTDSMHDDRTVGLTLREKLKAYCGVPLRNREGVVFATLCHFDVEPVTIDDENVALMESLAALLIDHDAYVAKHALV